MGRAIDIHIGKRLVLRRKERNMSCLDLEESASIAAASISAFEDGTIVIKADELFRIAAALETTIGFFYKDTD